jgi:multidrug efflux system membrane fusion protein
MTAKRRAPWVFVGMGIVAAALVAVVIVGRSKPARPPPAAVPVNVALVTAKDVPVSVSALGAAQAWQSAVIVAQVSGVLQRVTFTEGSSVRAGQVLAEIDPAPYRAALLQAKGALARDEAALQGARVNLARYQALAAQDSIAKQTVQDQEAVVKQDEGVVMLDRGQVAAAQVNLDRCHVISPIAGRAGVRLVDPGNLVGTGAVAVSTNGAAAGGASGSQAGAAGSITGGTTGSSGIVVINQIRPIAVTFTVPESDFDQISRASDGFRRPLPVEAFAQESGLSLGQGQMSIADNKVDPATGTVQLKARFENADQKLWPGQYVNVAMTVQTVRHQPTVPAAAVAHGPTGAFVYVIQSSHAQMRPVQVSTTQAGVAVIGEGLSAGETVVIDGQMALRPGAKVAIQTRRPVTAAIGAAAPAVRG